MLPISTIAVYCTSVEDAAEISELISMSLPRLFIIVGEDESSSNQWLHPRDAVVCVQAGLDGGYHTAVRCAMLFAPSYTIAFIDGTRELNITIDEISKMISDANKDGFAECDGHWAMNKMHAVQNGFPGATGIQPVSPDSQNLTMNEAILLITDLVPMFEVCISPSISTHHKEFRELLSKHITSYSPQNPSAFFVSHPEEVEEARKKIKITGKVVCLSNGPDGFEREIACQNDIIRIYTSSKQDIQA